MNIPALLSRAHRSNAAGYLALLLVLGFTPLPAHALALVTTKDLADGAVTTKKIHKNAVKGSRIAEGGVTGGHVKDGSLTAADLAAGVLPSPLSDGAVTSAKLGEGAVTTSKLSDGAVTSAKLSDGAVASAELADGSVGPADLSAEARGFGTLFYVTSARTLATGSATGFSLDCGAGSVAVTGGTNSRDIDYGGAPRESLSDSPFFVPTAAARYWRFDIGNSSGISLSYTAWVACLRQ